MWVLLKARDSKEPIMQTITTIGLDIARSVSLTKRECRLATLMTVNMSSRPATGARFMGPR